MKLLMLSFRSSQQKHWFSIIVSQTAVGIACAFKMSVKTLSVGENTYGGVVKKCLFILCSIKTFVFIPGLFTEQL